MCVFSAFRFCWPQHRPRTLSRTEPRTVSESELYRLISTSDPEFRMPPPDSGRELSPTRQDMLRRWIAQGAVRGEHWSWQPLLRPAVPMVPDQVAHTLIRNPIDAFIQSRLKASGLSPSPKASRSTLIRRISLELTGLPPTPAEVLAFEQDNRLDAARYADSNGYQGDTERTMWPDRGREPSGLCDGHGRDNRQALARADVQLLPLSRP